MDQRIPKEWNAIIPSFVFLVLMLALSVIVSAPVLLAADLPKGPKLDKIHMPFIKNEGQVASTVAYYADTFGGRMSVLKKGEIVLSLHRNPGQPVAMIREMPANAQINNPRGLDRASTKVNFFIGNDAGRWRTGVTTWETVTLGEVYAGIEMQLKPRGDNVEKLFFIHPGGDPASIAMEVQGVDRLTIDDLGHLVLHTPHGNVTYTRPVAYQEIDGQRHDVAVTYQIHDQSYGFTLGPYREDRTVVIDPLLQSTYLGGSSAEYAQGMVFSPTGDVYISGYTHAGDWPDTVGGYQPDSAGGLEAFIVLLNADLTTIEQMTYLGTVNGDYGRKLALHPISGDVYLSGHTTGLDFPGTAGGAQPNHAFDYLSNSDFFISRLSPDLSTLIQSTYLGGDYTETLTDMAIHPVSGDVYVVGYSNLHAVFPGTIGGAQSSGTDGTSDVIVARLSADLRTFYQASFIGGTEEDGGFIRIRIHPDNGDIYVSGNTYSDDLPATTGGAQATFGGIRDTFIARLNPALTAFTQVTYLGGSGVEMYESFAIDPGTGKVFVTGNTYSTDFPNVAGGYQTEKLGSTYSEDVFIARLNADLTVIEQSTYLGGSDDEIGVVPLDFHPDTGDLIVAGPTTSDDFPGTAGGVYPYYKYSSDAFLARMDTDLTTLYQATYLGGYGGDDPYVMAIHPTTGNIYLAGTTTSTAFPGVTGGVHETINGTYDIYVACLTSSLTPIDMEGDIDVSLLSHSFGNVAVGDSSAGTVITISNAGDDDLSVSGIANSNATDFSVDTGGSGCGDNFVLAPGASCTFSVIFHPSAEGASTASITISSDDADEATVVVALSGIGTVPDISLSSASHDFGDLEIGSTSGTVSFTITNDGNADLAVSAIANSNSSDFTLNTGTCGDSFTLAPAADCSFSITFHPTAEGAHSADITISSNDPDEATATIALSGTGTAAGAPEPDISLSSTTHDFGDLDIGSTSGATTFTITNDGGADLDVSAIANSNSSDFTLNTGTCGDSFTLAPAADCSFSVTFHPTTEGTRSAEITTSSDDPDEGDLSLAISGTGTIDDGGDDDGDSGGSGGGGGGCFIDVSAFGSSQ